MAVWRSGNWSFKDPPFQDGDIVEGANCTQLQPDTEICAGVTSLTINGGNFTNCRIQPTWARNHGNNCQKSFCSHLHPEWVARGLSECDENCAHVVDSDTIEIDGEVVEVIYHYKDTVL